MMKTDVPYQMKQKCKKYDALEKIFEEIHLYTVENS